MAANFKSSEEAHILRKSFEGFTTRAYPDPKTGGYPWTNGWGSTTGVRPGDVWTEEQAERAYMEDVAHAEALVNKYVTVPVTQGIYDAMVDIVYNVGPGSATRDGIIRLKNGNPSTLLRKLNAGDYAGAGDAYDDWVSPGSNVEKGLRRRRSAFLKLWDKP